MVLFGFFIFMRRVCDSQCTVVIVSFLFFFCDVTRCMSKNLADFKCDRPFHILLKPNSL